MHIATLKNGTKEIVADWRLNKNLFTDDYDSYVLLVLDYEEGSILKRYTGELGQAVEELKYRQGLLQKEYDLLAKKLGSYTTLISKLEGHL